MRGYSPNLLASRGRAVSQFIASPTETAFLHLPRPASRTTTPWSEIPGATRFQRGAFSAIAVRCSATDSSWAGRQTKSRVSTEPSSILGRLPQDQEIQDSEIMVIDGSAPEGPYPPALILSKLEPHETLRMIRPAETADPENGRPVAKLALCKVFNTSEEYNRMKKRKADDASHPKLKSKHMVVELSWSVDLRDLDRKLKKMGKHLLGGGQVILAIERKRNGRILARSEAEEIVRRILAKVDQVGARKLKKPSGTILEKMAMSFEGVVRDSKQLGGPIDNSTSAESLETATATQPTTSTEVTDSADTTATKISTD